MIYPRRRYQHRCFPLIRVSLLISTAGLMGTAATAATDKPAHTEVSTLPPVIVQAPGSPERLSDGANAERRSTPGNLSVVPVADYENGAVRGMDDALSRVPGVYVQNPSGQVSARISMRGSGMTSSVGVRGVRMLRDGLPMARIDDLGDSIFGDPLGADFVQVLRGANAMTYGVATLGGALNLVSPTGHTRPGLRLRMDSGAYGFHSARVQWGQDLGNGWDAYTAASATRSEGARQHSTYAVNRYYGNVGFRAAAGSRGRFHYSQDYFSVQLPGALTWDEFQTDPRAANPESAQAGAHIRTKPHWHVAYIHEWDMNGGGSLSLGAYHTGIRYDSTGAVSDVAYDAVDYGFVLRQTLRGEIADREIEWIWGVNLGRGRDEHSATWPSMPFQPQLRALRGSPQASISGQRSNVEAYVQASLRVAPQWSLIFGGQGVRADRSTDNTVIPIARSWFANGTASATYTGFSPKVGFIWDLAPRTQVFGNLSGSFEPPNSINFFSPEGILDAQRATTLELGTRGGTARLGWEAAVYYSKVRGEVIEIASPGIAGITMGRNADRTRHMGLELSLSGAHQLRRVPGKLEWALAYTWNDFRFDGDPVFGDNHLPGIPAHVARLDLRYRHASGFYAGPTIELASGRHVDQANSLRAPGYGILGASMGFQAPDDRWRAYLDLRNLTDKHYVAATEYTVDARGESNIPVYFPGGGRMAFAGIEWHW